MYKFTVVKNCLEILKRSAQRNICIILLEQHSNIIEAIPIGPKGFL